MYIIEQLDAPWTEEERDAFIEKYRSPDYVLQQYTDKIESWAYDEFDRAEIIVPPPIPPTPEEQYEMNKEYFESQFFEIPDVGWYRKAPKGYASAIESLGVAYNMITSGAVEELPAGTFIFYQQPDYSDNEQCTEEWLVAHHILSPTMSKQEFMQFYSAFVVAWNQSEH